MKQNDALTHTHILKYLPIFMLEGQELCLLVTGDCKPTCPSGVRGGALIGSPTMNLSPVLRGKGVTPQRPTTR